jgi:uridylate kinase
VTIVGENSPQHMTREQQQQAFVVKIGGSEAINEAGVEYTSTAIFLRSIADTLRDCYGRGAFVIGGGIRSRNAIKGLTIEAARDEVGMKCTHEHAAQLNEIATETLGGPLHPRVPTNPGELAEVLSEAIHPVTLGGIQRGQTTDAVAFMAAAGYKNLGLTPRIVITSDVGSVYTANPKEDAAAQSIVQTTIEELLYRSILINDLNEYRSGMHTPLDPKAVQLLQELQAIVFFTKMSDVRNINAFLAGHPVNSGTLIGPELRFATR